MEDVCVLVVREVLCPIQNDTKDNDDEVAQWWCIIEAEQRVTNIGHFVWTLDFDWNLPFLTSTDSNNAIIDIAGREE